MKRGWFGPKAFGWGASPASWEGWLATLLMIVALVAAGAADPPRGRRVRLDRARPHHLRLSGRRGADLPFGCPHLALTPQDKVALRAEARARRKRLAALDPQAADRAASHAAALPSGDPVAVYRAIGSELDTDALALALIDQGRSLCLPVVLQPDAAMIFRLWSPGEPLEADAAGVPAPLPLAQTVIPQLILTPLLAFDDQGGRLGQGGGYYDRTFAALPDAIRVGFAYAGQQLDELPVEGHDIRLHGVLTEVGYTAARKVL